MQCRDIVLETTGTTYARQQLRYTLEEKKENEKQNENKNGKKEDKCLPQKIQNNIARERK